MMIVSAFTPELTPLSALTVELRLQTRTLGVGLVAAGVSMGRILARERPSAVILVGSCGIYPPSPWGHDVVVADRFVLVDGGAAEGRAAFPPIMATQLEADASWVARLREAGCLAGAVGTALAITTDDAWAGVLAQAGVTYENMEAFAVAHACREAGVPFAAVLGVTNVVGSQGRDAWRANHVRAAEDVARVVERALRTSREPRSPA